MERLNVAGPQVCLIVRRPDCVRDVGNAILPLLLLLLLLVLLVLLLLLLLLLLPLLLAPPQSCLVLTDTSKVFIPKSQRLHLQVLIPNSGPLSRLTPP